MSVSKIYLHSVLICPVLGSPVWGSCRLMGQWEWEVLCSAPVHPLLPPGGSSLPCLLCYDALPWGPFETCTKPFPNPCVATCPALAFPHPPSTLLARAGRRFTRRGPAT